MQAHFGKQACESTDGLQFNFSALKREYQGYERWQPKNVINEKLNAGFGEDEVQSMVHRLKTKTQAE